MKKIFILSLLVLVIVALTGCNPFSGGNGAFSTNDNPSNSNPSNNAAANNPSTNDGAAANSNPTNEPPANQSAQQPSLDGLTELQGVVLSANEQGAQIEKAIVLDLGDGITFKGTGGEDNETANIHWSADTVFELVIVAGVSNATISERRAATVHDVDIGGTLLVWGDFEHQSGFVVQRAEIWRFTD